jgi:hypothetical protein
MKALRAAQIDGVAKPRSRRRTSSGNALRPRARDP